ncbi:integrase core domain-containing protein [Deinococcus apachensis]|uniref:integrase core domain-containing protein n=1 Tax=Deinococcus apachensis TaxID=309886 RepID=UPI00146DCABC
MENAYIESDGGRVQDEYLDLHGFQTLAQARLVVTAWREDDNSVRPHSSWVGSHHTSSRAWFRRAEVRSKCNWTGPTTAAPSPGSAARCTVCSSYASQSAARFAIRLAPETGAESPAISRCPEGGRSWGGPMTGVTLPG